MYFGEEISSGRVRGTVDQSFSKLPPPIVQEALY